MQVSRCRSQVKCQVLDQRSGFDLFISQYRIDDEAVLNPTFIERLKEIIVVVRPFVHWCVIAEPVWPVRLITRSDSLNDMMTIQDPDEESSEDEGDDEDGGQDEDE